MIRFFLFSLFLGFTVSAQALKLELVTEGALEKKSTFKKTSLGGFSSMVWSQEGLWLLSDDKGKVDEPRFYEFSFELGKKSVKFKPQSVHFIEDFPEKLEKSGGLDPEGLVRLPDGDLIISSEGNNNSKPRTSPGIYRLSSKGKWKSAFLIPDKFLPEPVGQQKRGVQNNAAFEGLTSFNDGQFIFAAIEHSLIQDIREAGQFIRILKYGKEEQGTRYDVLSEYAYKVDELAQGEGLGEVKRGVSEILALSETQLLVLERGATLDKKGVAYTGSLYLADLSGAQDVKSFEVLPEAVKPVKKTLLLDLAKVRGDKMVQNFEGLSWGPVLPDGRKTLLVISDDNFSKKEATELLVFAIESE